MASVTQTIHSYTGGISQQPDEKKVPGQVVDAINVLPDVTEGLQKRPGAELVASLSDNTTTALNSTANGRWFHYYRDENEQYIGQVSRTGDVNMWCCSDIYVSGVKRHSAGDALTVTPASGALGTYLTHTADQDIQTLTLNDYTYITNRLKPTGMLAGSESTARPAEAYIQLKKVAYAKQYSLNLFDDTSTQTLTTATRISTALVASSNNYCNGSGALVVRGGRETQSTRCTSSAGSHEDSLAPNTATDIFSVGSGTELTDDDYTYTIAVYNKTDQITSGITYARSNATITITHSSHGYATGQDVHLNFNASSTDGRYTITKIDNNTYTVTDYLNSSGTDSGNVTVIPGNTTVGAKTDLYFQITNISQSIPQGSGNSIVYYTRYTTTEDLLYGGKGWAQGDFFYVWMKNALYQIVVDSISTAKVQANLGLIRPQPTPFDNEQSTTAELILGDIQDAIVTAKKSDGSNSVWYNAYSDVQIIGNGIYLTDAASFNVTAVDEELLNVVTDEIQSIDDLPHQCKHGFVVKVKNSEANEDDYYLKFQGQNDRDGKGSWEECPAPGRLLSFDPAKMPVQLVRKYNSSNNKVEFDLQQITWTNCLVGDTATVPKPSFISTENGVDGDDADVDRYINKMIFWRNRLVFLSEEDVILSQPGEFFNFWPKSSITYTATDVIDISCSSEYPADLYDGIHTNSGLVLFTKTTQFLLTTDSDVLSPQTAKLNTISSYNFNHNTNPISLGTTIGFLDNAGKYSRFWEMANVLREGEPQVIDQTKVVSKLFDKNLNKISNSRENSIVFFSEKDKNILYGFSYYATSEKRLQQAWFKWTFSGTIQHHAVLDDALYLIIRDDSKDTMQRIPIKMDTSTLSITDDLDTTDTTDDITYRIHLDNSQVITASQLGYSTTSGRTGFTKPDGFNSTTGQLVVYCHQASTTLPNSDPTTDAQDSDLIGSYTTASIVGNPGNYNIEWDGDWTGHDIIVGYLFDMEVEFPTIYTTQTSGDNTISNTNGSLVVHRVKLNFGASGMYTTILDRTGKPQYTKTWEPLLSDIYSANQVGINKQITQTVPTYEKNKNLTLTLKSSHPAPATLYSMTWEGDYTNAYYKSV